MVIAAAPAMALTMSLGLGLEAFSRRRAAGLAVAFAGVVVVILLGSGQTVSLDTVRGPLLVLVSASSFAAYNVLVKPLLGRFDAIAISAAASLVGTAALFPFAASGTARRLGGMSAGDLLLVLYLGLVCTLAGLRALDDCPALARPVARGRLPLRRAGRGGRGRGADARRERDGVARRGLRARRRRGGARAMTAFVWRDGERTIRFGPGASAHAWPGADVLTTARAERDIPAAVLEGARVHHVPAGQVPDAAAALIDRVGDGRMVAWGGGRVIDTAKALAAARGGQVCAVPTTLSGAEMSRGHRPAPGYEGRPNHRPVLVLAEPELMAGQPAEARRASAMNALAHAAEALYGPGPKPGGVDGRRPRGGAPGARRRGGRPGRPRAGGPAGRICAGLGRVLAPPRALPDRGADVRDVAFRDERRRAAVLRSRRWRPREPEAIAELAAALGVEPSGLAERVSALAGGARLGGEGVGEADLPAVADAALERSELAALSPPPGRDELVEILRRAL